MQLSRQTDHLNHMGTLSSPNDPRQGSSDTSVFLRQFIPISFALLMMITCPGPGPRRAAGRFEIYSLHLLFSVKKSHRDSYGKVIRGYTDQW